MARRFVKFTNIENLNRFLSSGNSSGKLVYSLKTRSLGSVIEYTIEYEHTIPYNEQIDHSSYIIHRMQEGGAIKMKVDPERKIAYVSSICDPFSFAGMIQVENEKTVRGVLNYLEQNNISTDSIKRLLRRQFPNIE